MATGAAMGAGLAVGTVMGSVLTELAMGTARTVVAVLTASMLAVFVMAMLSMLSMFSMALPLWDDAGASVFLTPLAAGGAQIAMPAAAGAYVLVFFHYDIESFRSVVWFF